MARHVSLESFAIQSDKFFNQLVESITFLRNDGRYTTKEIKESLIMDHINKQTGMNVELIIKKGFMGAYVMLPNVDRNHPFINSSARKFMGNDVGVSAINFKAATPQGYVDTSTCRVSGWYSEIVSPVTIGLELLSSPGFTAEEIAAVLLHELGHLYTYFLLLGTTVLSSLVIAATAKECVGAVDYGKRVYVLKEAEKTLGIEIPNKEGLAKVNADKDAKGIQVVMLTSLAEKARSDTGFNYYEMRSCEQLADKFAVRHGAGIHLASALEKIYTTYGHSSYRNRMLHIFGEIVKLILFCLGMLLGPLEMIALVCYVIFYNPMGKVYDDPKQRLTYIRTELIKEIKERKLPEERRQQIIVDAELIQTMIDKADDKLTFTQVFWKYCRSEGSKAVKQEELAKNIETLSNNDLFLNAAKFAAL